MSEHLIYSKMIAILKEVEFISKAKTNTSQNYKFRGIDDMYNALHDLFAKHEVFITSEVLKESREERQTQKGGILLYTILDVKFTCWAIDGSSIYSIMKGEAMDSGDKASNKAMSTALKYFLMQTFLIPTEEKLDTEYENHEPMPKEQPIDKMKTLSQDIKDAFAALGFRSKPLKAFQLCQDLNWDEAKIKERLNSLANEGK